MGHGVEIASPGVYGVCTASAFSDTGKRGALPDFLRAPSSGACVHGLPPPRRLLARPLLLIFSHPQPPDHFPQSIATTPAHAPSPHTPPPARTAAGPAGGRNLRRRGPGAADLGPGPPDHGPRHAPGQRGRRVRAGGQRRFVLVAQPAAGGPACHRQRRPGRRAAGHQPTLRHAGHPARRPGHLRRRRPPGAVQSPVPGSQPRHHDGRRVRHPL